MAICLHGLLGAFLGVTLVWRVWLVYVVWFYALLVAFFGGFGSEGVVYGPWYGISTIGGYWSCIRSTSFMTCAIVLFPLPCQAPALAPSARARSGCFGIVVGFLPIQCNPPDKIIAGESTLQPRGSIGSADPLMHPFCPISSPFPMTHDTWKICCSRRRARGVLHPEGAMRRLHKTYVSYAQVMPLRRYTMVP